MISVHRLGVQQFDEMAAGYGGPDAVAALRAGQVSRRLLLLRGWLDGPLWPKAQPFFELLKAAQAASPTAFQAAVAAPGFGVWVARARRAQRPAEIEMAVGYFGALAAAAAIRAGLDFEITVDPIGGGVYLPGLGRASVHPGPASVVSKARETWIGGVHVEADSTSDSPLWSPLRRIRAVDRGLAIEVELDDLDPYRGCHGLPASDYLPASEVERWQDLLNQGWSILARHHAEHAPAIAAGLTNIVPLHEPDTSKGVNATSMEAFGSVSLSPPADDLAMACGLLHEFQHAKLGALLDLIPLYEPGGDRRYYAPWRDDPRPLGALFQGVYAFLGVTDFYRVQRDVATGERADLAEFEFARWRDRVWVSFQVLAESGRFNAEGGRFLDGLRATQEAWLSLSVSPIAGRLAAEAADEHRLMWRLRNLRPDPDRVSALAAAWSDGRPGDLSVAVETIVDDDRALTRNVRLDLAALRINDPQRFAAVVSDSDVLHEVAPNASAADAAYARGDFADAVAAYRAAIMLDPSDRSSWVGLAVATRAAYGQAPTVLFRTPEVVYAVHRALVAQPGPPAPDPLRVAAWLGGDGSGDGHVAGGSTTQ